MFHSPMRCGSVFLTFNYLCKTFIEIKEVYIPSFIKIDPLSQESIDKKKADVQRELI